MLKAVIFDMDGVIVDSEPIHARAAVTALAAYNVTITTDYCYQFIGSTTKHMLETIINEQSLSLSCDELLKAIEAENKKIIKEEGYPIIAGIQELIADLYKNGVQLAVASSSTLKEITTVIKSLKLTKYFDKLISGCDVPNPKPSPDIFLKTIKELGLSPDDCIIIEDSQNGTIAAKASNIACIGFSNPNSGKQNLDKADVIIESFTNIDYQFILDEYKRANNQPVTIAKTKRLIIRELSIDDIKEMYRIYQNPSVKEFIDDIDDYLEVEIEKHKAYIRNIYGFYGYGLWGVFSKTTKALIGRCGIENKIIEEKQEFELSYILDQQHWGYGYALECVNTILDYAADKLEISSLVAIIDMQNIRSIRVVERVGFVVEKKIKRKNRLCYLYRFSIKNRKSISY